MDSESLGRNVRHQLGRIIYMLIFVAVLYVVMMLVGIVVAVQLLFALFTGEPNAKLTDFSEDLSHYVFRIVSFLTYVDDSVPFPFDKWEEDDVVDEDIEVTIVEPSEADKPSEQNK